jgi:hypothetical protein
MIGWKKDLPAITRQIRADFRNRCASVSGIDIPERIV